MSKFEVGTVCDRGLSPRRPINEDRYLAIPEKGLFVVADGVGGELAGEVASQTVVDQLTAFIHEYDCQEKLEESLARSLQQINQQIYEAAQENPGLTGMASTVALVCINGKWGIVAHVGDSRVYTLRSGVLRRETRDHNDLEDALRAGEITEADALTNTSRNIINRALGAESIVEPEFSRIDMSKTEAILLCTDGITRHILDQELEELLLSDLTPQQISNELKWRCHWRGAEDNLTAIVIKNMATESERTLPPVKTTSRLTLNNSSRQTSLIKVNVGDFAKGQSDEPEHILLAESPGKPAGTRHVLTNALLILIAILLLGGAFYAGIYVAQKNLIVPHRANVSVGGDEFGDYNYLREGASTNTDFQKALELFDNHEYSAARSRFQTLALRVPAQARYHYWLARACFETADYANALKGFQKAISLNLSVPTVYLYEALTYQALGREKEAAQSFKRFAEEREKS
ncbi:MAG: protein phosphatase 2C domain-containing protein [Acidobacteriota bacterium]